MDLISIDLMIRSGAMSLCILLAIFLWRDHRAALAAKLAMCLSFGVICYLTLETPGPRPFSVIDFCLFAGEVSIYGTFWLFARAWFNDEQRFGWRSWACVGGSISLSMVSWTSFKANHYINWFSDIPMRVVWLVFVLAALRIAWQGRGNDLVEARRRIRIGFVLTVGGTMAAATLIFFVNNLIFDQLNRYTVVIVVNIGIVIVLMLLITRMVKSDPADLFAAPERPNDDSDDIPDAAGAELAQRLQDYLLRERAYRDEAMTIAKLAAALNEREYRLRRVINGQLGYRNFSNFLNDYRLREVKQALTDPDQQGVPILTIALDSGFGSLAPFNRAFRDAEGVTPTEYRKNHTD